MLKTVLFTFSYLIIFNASAQTGFTSATPIGGFSEFYRHIAYNLQYPTEARRAGISGKVMVQFTIDTSGVLSKVEAIEGPKYGMDKEAVRLVENSPPWNPANRDGKPVKTVFKIPIEFSLPQFSVASVEDIIKIKPEITNLELPGIGLKELSSRINELYNLRKIDVNNNHLSDLPMNLEKIQFLKELNLSQNDFNEIPNVLLRCENLKELNLDGNKISEVPREIFLLSSLKVLSLMDNPIKYLPDNISESTIKKLILKGTDIPEEEKLLIKNKLPKTKVVF